MQASGKILHIGDNIDFHNDIDNLFSVTFLPLDFFDSWERGSLLSNFVADYYGHNFPGPEARNLISTVVNELIENAVKFSRNNSMPVIITIKKRKEEMLIQADNCLPKHRQDAFVAVCREISEKDLDELYVKRMHENLKDPNSSGIGLILIKKDYCAGLSFSFYTDDRHGTHVAVTAKLDFDDLRKQQ
ncbi:MAG: hypothetical protein JW852_06730 [Spirochaetales bacterium]|nr:hypothetical protein [Spirochaetales bacterium]